MSNIIKDPRQFWQDIKRYSGTNKTKSPYLLNSQNEKIFEEKDKMLLHSNFWSKTFQITPDDNQLFDQIHETNICAHVNNNRGRLSSDTTVDLSKLSNTSSLTEPITSREVTETIKHMKNKAPGESTINKTDLQNLPPVMIHRLTNIMNASLASGHFPKKIKNKKPLSLLFPSLVKPQTEWRIIDPSPRNGMDPIMCSRRRFPSHINQMKLYYPPPPTRPSTR